MPSVTAGQFAKKKVQTLKPIETNVMLMETDPNKKRALLLSIECINTLNEGLHFLHAAGGCPKPKWSRYLSFLKSRTFSELTRPKYVTQIVFRNDKAAFHKQLEGKAGKSYPKIHTIFSTECTPYFDWQTIGFVHSFNLSGQPGNVTRLLSCTDEELKQYRGHDLAPTHYVPSMSRHPLTGDWYPAINKPAAVLHWINHAIIDAEFIVILDADMILKGPITPWEFKAERGRPVSAPYDYLIGCNNVLAKLHTRNPQSCDKVGGVIIMHIEDLRNLALLWLHKTEEVKADKEHYATNVTGDIYGSGWISEMYGYSFAAAELNLRHTINRKIMIYPGYVPEPGASYRVFHYGLEFKVGNWSFDKAKWRDTDMVSKCWARFPDPPDPSTIDTTDENARQRDLLSIECARTLNDALFLHHKKRNCPIAGLVTTPKLEEGSKISSTRKLGKIDETYAERSNSVPRNNSEELTSPIAKEQMLSSFRFWIVALWATSFFCFVALMLAVFSRDVKRKIRGKHHKSRKRSSYSSGVFDSNGIDRHLRSAEISEKL
ncbi:Peptidyl serine alpha-galactosyltransferase [Dionaea muscipula]